MTIKELREALDNSIFEDDDEVYFAYPSRDYWHTTVVVPVRHVEMEAVKWSAYHEKLQTTNEESDTDQFVLVLSD